MRVSKHPSERRAELIRAARRLFDEKGVEKTRVSDIVAAVGVAQGVFYYYFSSKEEMTQVVTRQVGEEMEAAAKAILADETQPFAQKLAGFIELYLGLVDQFLGDDEINLAPLAARKEKGGTTAQHAGKVLTELCFQLIEAGRREGDVGAMYPKESAKVLLCGLQALAEEKLPGRKKVYAIVEEGLCMENNSLRRYL